jgi:hypothetical protein
MHYIIVSQIARVLYDFTTTLDILKISDANRSSTLANTIIICIVYQIRSVERSQRASLYWAHVYVYRITGLQFGLATQGVHNCLGRTILRRGRGDRVRGLPDYTSILNIPQQSEVW